MGVEQLGRHGTCLYGGEPEDPAADRVGKLLQHGDGQGDLLPVRQRRVQRRVRHRIEVLRVRPQQVGRAREGGRHPGAELLLEQRQHLRPHPHAGELLVGVVRVGPELDALGQARGLGVGAGEVEQRAPVDLERTSHPRQRPPTRSTGQPEEHRLRLVVEGVPEQHDPGREPLRDLGEYGVASLARRCLGTETGRLDLDPGGHRLGDTERPHLLGHPVGVLGRPGLQPVVDGRADHLPGSVRSPRRRSRPAGRASPPHPSRRPRRCHRDRGRPAFVVRRGAPQRPRGGATRLSRGPGRSRATGRGSPAWSAGWPAPPTRR